MDGFEFDPSEISETSVDVVEVIKFPQGIFLNLGEFCLHTRLQQPVEA
jgi:hypothetical protein